MSNLIFKMSVDNKLSPELTKAINQFKDISTEAYKLTSQLDLLKANKQGILTGAIKSDNKEIAKLQANLLKLRDARIKAEAPVQRRAISVDENKAKALLLSAYNRELIKTAKLEKEVTRESKAMAKSLERQYKVTDKATNSTKKLNTQTRQHSTNQKNATNDVVRHIRQVESLLVAFYALKRAYDVTIGAGHEFNKLIEQETIGLKLLISQNLQTVDVLGNSVNAQQRYAFAVSEASKAVELARKINVKTPHSFKETLQIFKLLTPQVLKYGGTLEEVGEITQKMSVIAQSMGIEFQQFLKTVDSALSGEMKESGLKRALEQFGVTNEGIKEIKKRNGDVVGYVIQGLEQAKEAGIDIFGSWAGVTAQFKNEWDDLFGKLQKPLFEAMKREIVDITKVLKDNQGDIIKTVETLTKLGSHLATLALAYGTSRVAMALFNKGMRVYSTNLRILTSLHAVHGTTVSRSTLSLIRFGKALKTLVVSNAPLLILFGAFEAWNLIMADTEDRLDKVAEASSRTREELLLLGEQSLSSTKTALQGQIQEVEKAIKAIEKSKRSIGASFLDRGTKDSGFSSLSEDAQHIGYLKAFTGSEEDIREALQEQYEIRVAEKKELEETLGLHQSITPEIQAVATATRDLESIISRTNQDIVAQKRLLDNIVIKEGESVTQLEERKNKEQDILKELQDQLVSQKEGRVELQKLSTELGVTQIAFREMAKDAEAMAKSLSKATKEAYSLSQAVLEGEILRGEVTGLGAIEARNKLEIERINNAETGAKLERKLLEQQNKYTKETQTFQKKIADDREQAEKSYSSALLANYRAKGQETKVLQFQIDLINNKEIPQAQKLLEIETLRLNLANKGAKGREKGLAKAQAEAEALYRTFLEITGEDNLLEAFDIEKIINEFREAGYEGEKLLKIKEALEGKSKREFDTKFALDSPTIVEEVFNPYLNLIESQKEYIANIKKAGNVKYKIDKINSKQTSLQLKGYAGLANGLKGFFKESSKGYKALNTAQKVLQAFEFAWFIKKQILEATSIGTKLANTAIDTTTTIASETSKSTILGVNAVLAQGQGDPYTAWARMGAMVAVVAGLGVAIGGISGGGDVSEADLEKAKGMSSSDYTDESLANLGDIFESAQYPMLEVTNKMYRHLRSMDENFYSIARAIAGTTTATGIDITGGSFIEGIYDGSYYSTKTKELVGAGLVFKEQTLEALSSIDDIFIQGYESIKTTKEYWWKTSVTLATTLYDLPPEAVESFADAFANGYEAILSAGTILGIDQVDLSEALSQATIKLGDEEGKIDLSGLDAEGVADALNDIFSTAFSQVVDQIPEFSTLVDEFAKGTEQSLETLLRISLEFEQASHSFFLIGKEISSTFEALKIVESTGGLTEFQDAMSAFMTSFYTDAEQLEFLTKSMEQAFATLNLSMPQSNDEFRTLLETMDTTTEEGQYLYGQVLLLAESFNTMSEASESLGDEMGGLIQEVADAWLGNLSYLTLQQKADYASAYLALAGTSDGAIDSVESARLASEFALQTTRTKEEYIPIFERYINEIEDKIEDATNTDLLKELKLIKIAIVEGAETATTDSIFGTGA